MEKKKLSYFALLATLTTTSHAATSVTFGPITSDSPSIDDGGYGSTPASDYLGVVTSTEPLLIDAGPTVVESGFSPSLGDVIGRDLASSGISFTGSTISWTVPIPGTGPDYIDNSFDLTAQFDASFEFLGNTFISESQPNALNITLSFDGSPKDTFQAQSGNHRSASLSSSQTNGNPVDSVIVTITFPNGNSFNAGDEQFRIFQDSLVVSGSYDVVPEPSASLFGSLALFGLLRRRR